MVAAIKAMRGSSKEFKRRVVENHQARCSRAHAGFFLGCFCSAGLSSSVTAYSSTLLCTLRSLTNPGGHWHRCQDEQQSGRNHVGTPVDYCDRGRGAVGIVVVNYARTDGRAGRAANTPLVFSTEQMA